MVLGTPLTDPTGSNALIQAAHWADSLLLGSVAVTAATLAVAAIGLGMLQGRLPARRGLTVILGCFVIFGATAISQELMSLRFTVASRSLDEMHVAGAIPPIAAPPQPQAYDPYAGASVPVR